MVDNAIDAYICGLPELRHARGATLHRRVTALFPTADARMQDGMPTYRFGGNFFAWASRKNYLSVYTCSAERTADFRSRHPGVRSGVGCLNFRDKDSFPMADLDALIRCALAPPADVLVREHLVRQAGGRARTDQAK